MKTGKYGPYDTGPDGNIILHPVTGWSLFQPFGMACGVRLDYARDAQHLEAILQSTAEADGLQIVLSPQQAVDLAEALQRLAARANEPPTGQAN